MIIQPIIKGQVAKSCHPFGCDKAVADQIDFVQHAKEISNGPQKVLILGASSGFGLASRICLGFGGPKADTIGVAFERGPSEKGVGTAGWYNMRSYKERAESEGLIAKNFIGDAFSLQMRRSLADYIRDEFGGAVDLVVYSLATGVRPDSETGSMIRSVIKPVGESFCGYSVNLETDGLEAACIEPATDQEIADTVAVMGGGDWQDWILFLKGEGLLAKGCQTVAYSYLGPDLTRPIYTDGTLGRAKQDLHRTADRLQEEMGEIDGKAHVAVCKALVTKASVFIPGLSPYLLALFKVMKEMGLHEGCIEQMHRLYCECLYRADGRIPVDEKRLVRIDDRELRPDIQEKVAAIVKEMTPDNFRQLGDYDGFKADFLKLNGFGLEGVDYQRDVDLSAFAESWNEV